MNPSNKDPRNKTSIRPDHAPAVSSGTSGDESKHAVSGGKPKPVARKPFRFSGPVFVIGGVILCMGLVCCVFPYDSNSDSHGAVTRYRPGYRVDSLPGGYRSETISGNTYYYHDGYYYRPGSGGYVIVDPPRNSRYYDDHNRRQRTYQSGRIDREAPDRHDGRYDRGEIITDLPKGHRVVNHRGETFYQVGDRYYRRQGDIYVVASMPR
jgi:hypothetical protein